MGHVKRRTTEGQKEEPGRQGQRESMLERSHKTTIVSRHADAEM